MINNSIVAKEFIYVLFCVTPSGHRKKNYAAPFLDFLPASQLVFVNNRTSCTGLLTIFIFLVFKTFRPNMNRVLRNNESSKQ